MKELEHRRGIVLDRVLHVMLEATSLFASARAEGSTGNSNNTKHSKTSSDNYNNSLRSHLGSRWDALRGGAEGSGRAAPWGLASPRTPRRPRTRGPAWCRQWGGRGGRRPPAAPACAIRRARSPPVSGLMLALWEAPRSIHRYKPANWNAKDADVDFQGLVVLNRAWLFGILSVPCPVVTLSCKPDGGLTHVCLPFLRIGRNWFWDMIESLGVLVWMLARTVYPAKVDAHSVKLVRTAT